MRADVDAPPDAGLLVSLLPADAKTGPAPRFAGGMAAPGSSRTIAGAVP